MVNQTGITVAAHQPLFTLYSPEIYQAESEFVATGGWTAGDHPNAGDSARRKLQLLGMSDADIDQVVKTKEPLRAITIHAPRAGYIAKKNVVAGSYVVPETALYEIQNLSQVYVVANVFQQDLAYVRRGSEHVRAQPAAQRNGQGESRSHLPDALNMEARTTRVRMLVQSPKDAPFRPGNRYRRVRDPTPARHGRAETRGRPGMYTYVFVVVDGRFAPRRWCSVPSRRKVTISGVTGERVVSEPPSSSTRKAVCKPRLHSQRMPLRANLGRRCPVTVRPARATSTEPSTQTIGSTARNAFRFTTEWVRWKPTA
jgi:hypothetical protein